jgi:hypothetical protein
MWGTTPKMVNIPFRKIVSRILSCAERGDRVSRAGLHTFRYRITLKIGGLSLCSPSCTSISLESTSITSLDLRCMQLH